MYMFWGADEIGRVRVDEGADRDQQHQAENGPAEIGRIHRERAGSNAERGDLEIQTNRLNS